MFLFLQLTEEAEKHRLGALRSIFYYRLVFLVATDFEGNGAIQCATRHGRSSDQRTHARARCRCKSARVALLLRLHLQRVSVILLGSPILRRLTFADVAHRFDLLAQRRRLGDARVQFAVHNAFILGGRLKVEEMRVRLFAAAQEKGDVVGVLQTGVPASVHASTRVLYLIVVRPLARLNERIDVDAGELQALARIDEARELFEAAIFVRVVCVLQRSTMRSRLNSHVRAAFTYALVKVVASESYRAFRQCN